MPLRGWLGWGRLRNVGLRNARSMRRRTETPDSSLGARILILFAAGGLFGCGADAPSDVGTHADLDELPWIPTPDGYVMVENEVPESESVLRITRLGHSGDTLATRLLGYQPKAFPDSILEATATEAAHQVGDSPIRTSSGVEFLERHAEDTAAARSAIRRQMDFPEFQASIQGHQVGADGSIWLRREDLGAEEHRWAVLGADLDPRGEVRIPRSFRILRVSTDGLWVAESDDLGIPWLVHCRLIEG